jgi:hypothetical protein
VLERLKNRSVVHGDVRSAERDRVSLGQASAGAVSGERAHELDQLPVPLVVDVELGAGDLDFADRSDGILGGEETEDVVVDRKPADAQEDLFGVVEAVHDEIADRQEPEHRRGDAVVGNTPSELPFQHLHDLLLETLHSGLEALGECVDEERARAEDHQQDQHFEKAPLELNGMSSQFDRSSR